MAGEKSGSIFRHRMALWGLFIAFLFTAWFGGWFVFAHIAENKIEEATVRLQEQGVEVICTERAMKGFPFRIGVDCDQVNIAVVKDGLHINGGKFATTSILYDPTEMIAELDSPLEVLAGQNSFNADWEFMRLYANAELSGGFERISLNFKKLEAIVGADKLSVKEGSVHLRPTPVDVQSLDLAANGNGMVAGLANGLEIPSASLSLDAKLENGYADLVLQRLPLQAVLQDGADIVLRSARLATDTGGKLVFSGPLKLHTDGMLSGEVTIGLVKGEEVMAWAAQIDPQLQQLVSLAEQASNGMGQLAQMDGEEMRTIKLQIDRGNIRLGFISLGKIPSLQ